MQANDTMRQRARLEAAKRRASSAAPPDVTAGKRRRAAAAVSVAQPGPKQKPLVR